jgi:hypothetical protein
LIDIKLNLDKEFGPDGMDPLGDIAISDGTSTIVERTTYLDSRLAALIEGYDQTKSTNCVTVEIAEVRAPFRIEVMSDGLLIFSYAGHALIPETPETIETGLMKAARSFLEMIGSWPNAGRNTFLDPIREFISSGLNGVRA